jgi:hypothetical protein
MDDDATGRLPLLRRRAVAAGVLRRSFMVMADT